MCIRDSPTTNRRKGKEDDQERQSMITKTWYYGFVQDMTNRRRNHVGIFGTRPRVCPDGSAADHGGRCLLYTSDAADERSRVDIGGRRKIKKKKNKKKKKATDDK